VSVAVCPARRGNRKGMVEKTNHTAAQRWWRTLADDVSPEQAQAALDRWCGLRGDTRLRPTGDGKATVVTIAASEPSRRCRRRSRRSWPCRPTPVDLITAAGTIWRGRDPAGEHALAARPVNLRAVVHHSTDAVIPASA
jgi:hypothetical protein